MMPLDGSQTMGILKLYFARFPPFLPHLQPWLNQTLRSVTHLDRSAISSNTTHLGNNVLHSIVRLVADICLKETLVGDLWIKTQWPTSPAANGVCVPSFNHVDPIAYSAITNNWPFVVTINLESFHTDQSIQASPLQT
ncbi:unnamed protein product [Mucor circinelloides]